MDCAELLEFSCLPQRAWVSEAGHSIWTFLKAAVSKCVVTRRLTSGTKWLSSGRFLLGYSHTCKWSSANNEIFRSSIIRFFPSFWGRTTEADGESRKTPIRVLTSPEKPWSALTSPPSSYPSPHHISVLFFIYNRGEVLSWEQKKLGLYLLFDWLFRDGLCVWLAV